MDFTFIRAARSQEENQERAFIAASRRKDRDFGQRMESLRKASELHCARTGRRFQLSYAQIARPGPVMEITRGVEQRRRENRRFEPYSHRRHPERQERRNENVVRHDSSQYSTTPSSQTLTQTTLQPTQIQDQRREQEIIAPDTETVLYHEIFNDSNGLENYSTEFEDAFQAIENANSNTTRPGIRDSIEEPLYLGKDTPSLLFYSDGWKTFRESAFNDLMGYEDLSQLPSLSIPQHQVSPMLLVGADLTQTFEETHTFPFSIATPDEIIFEHIEDVQVGVAEKDVNDTDNEV